MPSLLVSTCCCLLVVVLLPVRLVSSQMMMENGGDMPMLIPGMTLTDNGYDTELGTDPICWLGLAAANGDNSDNSAYEFGRPELVSDFATSQLHTLAACPEHHALHVFSPMIAAGQRMRTVQASDYEISLSLDPNALASILEESSDVVANNRTTGPLQFVSDTNGSAVSVQLILCRQGKTGFCHPYIHEETRVRLFNSNNETSMEDDNTEMEEDGTTTSYLHGGTHAETPATTIAVPLTDNPVVSLNLTLPVKVMQEGSYFVICVVHLFVGTASNNTVLARMDMANALPLEQRAHVVYQAPAVINELTPGVLYFSYVCMIGTGLVILFFLVETIKHRQHQVLQLTQGYFLIAFQVFALSAIVGAYLFQPKNDMYCQAGCPLILISVQAIYAITAGRLWRINSVISPLLARTMMQEEQRAWHDRVMYWLGRLTSCCSQDGGGVAVDSNGRKPRKLRKQISWQQLLAVILLFVFPQVVFQILSITLQPFSRQIMYNDDMSIGRVVCSSGTPEQVSFLYYGFYCFALLVIGVMLVAHATSSLPCLFNETKVMYDSAVTSLTLLVFSVGISFVADNPSTSPAWTYLGWVGLTLSIALNTTVRIMLPKLRIIWRGETVLVSKLVSDHSRSIRAMDQARSSATNLSSSMMMMQGGVGGVSGLDLPTRSSSGMNDSYYFESPSARGNPPRIRTNSSSMSERLHSGTEEHSGMGAEVAAGDDHRDDDDDNAHPFHSNTTALPSALKSSQQDGTPHARKVRIDQAVVGKAKQQQQQQYERKKIVVSEQQTPARRLLLKMLDLQRQLTSVNTTVMTGLAVPKQDWEQLRLLAENMGTTFQNVEFEWEQQQETVTTTPEKPLVVVESSTSTTTTREGNEVLPFGNDTSNNSNSNHNKHLEWGLTNVAATAKEFQDSPPTLERSTTVDSQTTLAVSNVQRTRDVEQGLSSSVSADHVQEEQQQQRKDEPRQEALQEQAAAASASLPAAGSPGRRFL